jgi:hypothetical protein
MKSTKEPIPKTFTLDPYPQTKLASPIVPPVKKTADKKQTVQQNVESQFHIFKKVVEKETPNSGFSNPDNSAHSAIQSSWAAFTGMSDGQRNQMLKGILSKCSSKQVDYICTLLNLKMVGESNKLHVFYFTQKRLFQGNWPISIKVKRKISMQKKMMQGRSIYF